MSESRMTQNFHAAGNKRHFYTAACLHCWKQTNEGTFALFLFWILCSQWYKNAFNSISKWPVDIKIFFLWLVMTRQIVYFCISSINILLYFVYIQSCHIIILYSFNHSKTPYNVDERPLISLLGLRKFPE